MSAAPLLRHLVRAAAAAALLAIWTWPVGEADAPADAAADAPTPAPQAGESALGAARAVSPKASAASTAAPAPRSRSEALAALDTRLIQERSGEPGTQRDAFAARSWTPPPPPPPPPPQAPPLPFKYMGMLDETPTRTVWYLTAGERLIVAAAGEVIDSVWRLDGVEADQLQFTYLPLEQKLQLAIGGPP